MAKTKLTIQELKQQKEDLKRYRRYLPNLVLKKLQIQIEVNRLKTNLDEKIQQQKALMGEIDQWIAVMGEDAGITEIVQVEAIETGTTNVAGVEIPLFQAIRFKEWDYDLYTTPLWVDRAVQKLRDLLTIKAEILIMETQIERLEMELRTTIQRVNLFEKIKIPEAIENIRVIQIFLGDQQTAEVVRGKISKNKVAQRSA
jgi:V/A-type H+-transporting ATPase subunit D